MQVSLFDFDLPPERIASKPAEPRDTARLLLLKAAESTPQHATVRDIIGQLKAGDVMVFNDSRVIPARLFGLRGEAKVEILLHRMRGLGLWDCFAKPAKKLRVDDIVEFEEGLRAKVLAKHEDGQVQLMFECAPEAFFEIIERIGHMPLPPYIQREDEESDKTRYQTVYSDEGKKGSVAAPTAGLHFTPELLAAIDAAGVSRVHVTLHVGAGTFQPVKVEDTAEHQMHYEYAEISAEAAETINAARAAGGRVIAVGTTSVRTLEAAAAADGRLQTFAGETDIFITPGYRFKVVDVMMTNFHLPKSTLFMLVSAFAGRERMQAAYAEAIAKEYRFYSYGDACWLERHA